MVWETGLKAAERSRSTEDIVGNFDEGCLCDVVGLETGLEGFIELMVGQVLVELGGDRSFQDFAEKRISR